MIPDWLTGLAILSLVAALLCAAWIAMDELVHPQKMWIMNAVWPLTALFGGLLALWFYYAYGRMDSAKSGKQHDGTKAQSPFPIVVAKGALHCGSGCTLGDIVAETLAFFLPGIAIWFGWQTLFSDKLIAVWLLAFVLAFIFGIAFQYFTIKPMRNLSVRDGLIAALKADALSLTAWQIGMYAVMAVAQFLIFMPMLGKPLDAAMPAFWFMMQLAMLAGFVTSYPVNWWLIRIGIKEAM